MADVDWIKVLSQVLMTCYALMPV